VSGDRLSNLAELAAEGLGDLGPTRLCELCAQVVGVSGVGIMLMTNDESWGSVSANPASALIEDLQHRLGEGPCVDAYRDNRTVREPELAHPATPRWPAFSPPAVEAGVRAIFGLPLRVGALRLGALNLYCDTPGALSADQEADALVLARIAAHAVLVLQVNAPPDRLAEQAARGGFDSVLQCAVRMVAVQLDIDIPEALARLRAFAFSHDHPLAGVAEDVVAHRLLFDDVDARRPRSPLGRTVSDRRSETTRGHGSEGESDADARERREA